MITQLESTVKVVYSEIFTHASANLLSDSFQLGYFFLVCIC